MSLAPSIQKLITYIGFLHGYNGATPKLSILDVLATIQWSTWNKQENNEMDKSISMDEDFGDMKRSLILKTKIHITNNRFWYVATNSNMNQQQWPNIPKPKSTEDIIVQLWLLIYYLLYIQECGRVGRRWTQNNYT